LQATSWHLFTHTGFFYYTVLIHRSGVRLFWITHAVSIAKGIATPPSAPFSDSGFVPSVTAKFLPFFG